MGYDASPFKVRPCATQMTYCDAAGYLVPAKDLPDPQVELPPLEEVDHWHILPRGGGDNRGARDMERWRSIALSAARCEHGRMQDDTCVGCPGGWSPSRAGHRTGTAYDGRAVVVPSRDKANDPSEWMR